MPQLVAPGCYDLVDLVGWQPTPNSLSDRPIHVHNRLLTSAVLDADERRQVAATICDKLSSATAPVALLLPTGGCNEWDRPGADLHDADGLAAFCEEITSRCPDTVDLHVLDCHINDQEFTTAALKVFDFWLENGTVKAG